MDLDEAKTLDGGPTGGLLRDLGSHPVDQALWLLGPAASVHAHLSVVDLPEGQTDAGFVLAIRHPSGVSSYLSASKLNRLTAREWRLYGAAGSYVSSGKDFQAQAIFADRRPADDLAGWGSLRTAEGARPIPSEQGRYHAFTRLSSARSGPEAQSRSRPRRPFRPYRCSTPHAPAPLKTVSSK